MTSSTRWRVAPLVGRLPDSTWETVLMDTFAARATSRMVTAFGRWSWSSRPTESRRVHQFDWATRKRWLAFGDGDDLALRGTRVFASGTDQAAAFQLLFYVG